MPILDLSAASFNIGRVAIDGSVRRRIRKVLRDNVVIPGIKRMVNDLNRDMTPFKRQFDIALRNTEVVRDLLDSGSNLVGALGIGPITGYPETVKGILNTIVESLEATLIEGNPYPSIAIGIPIGVIVALADDPRGQYTSVTKHSGKKTVAQIKWLSWLLRGVNDPIFFHVSFDLNTSGAFRSRTGLALMKEGGTFSIDDWAKTDPNFIDAAFFRPNIERIFPRLLQVRIERNFKKVADQFVARSSGSFG